MKKIMLALSMATILLLSSCAPKIGRSISKTYPSLEPDAPIEVYSARQNLPVSSESLGVIRISDSGTTSKCDSATVVNLIKTEARKVGGNAILITDHVRPSFWGSTCHQMTATLLNVSDFSNTAAPNQLTELTGNIYPLPLEAANKNSLPKMRIAASLGYGWRTAKTLDNEMKSYIDGLKSGLIWDASFNYYFNDNYGIGLFYTAYSASASALAHKISDDIVENGTLKTKDNITFVGPAFLMRFSQNQKWIFDMNLGLGYIGYTTKSTFSNTLTKGTGASVGFLTSFGAEYKFNKSWGIGANLSAVSGILNQMKITDENGRQETVKFPDDAKEGLAHLRLSMGIRYYIK